MPSAQTRNRAGLTRWAFLSVLLVFAIAAGGAAAKGGVPQREAAEVVVYKPVSTAPGADKLIALSFNDGPVAETTPQVMSTLKRYGARATFFVVGAKAREHRDIVAELKGAGFEIANHTYEHRSPQGRRAAEILDDIQRAASLIKELTGGRPTLLRPPGGDATGEFLLAAQRSSHRLVMWSNIGLGDIHINEPAVLAGEILRISFDGAVIMLHDTLEVTVRALPGILEGLTQKGYRFVTISELDRKGYRLPVLNP